MKDPYGIGEIVFFKVGQRWKPGVVVDFIIDQNLLPKRILKKVIISDKHYCHFADFEDVKKMSDEELMLYKLENPDACL